MSKQTTRMLLVLAIIMTVVGIVQGSQVPLVMQIPIRLEVHVSVKGRPPGVEVYGLRRVPPGTYTLLFEQNGVWSVTLSQQDAGKTFGDPPLFRVVAYDLEKKELIIELYDLRLGYWGRPLDQ